MTESEPERISHPEHDHNLCIRNAISVAEQLCLSRGVQLTPIRHKILELIWNSHKAVKAYDLLDQIRPVNDAAKPSTVYRALDFLLEQGLIHRVESLNAFVGCHCSGTQHDQLLLICTACHTVEERAAPAVLSALGTELGDAGFVPQRKTIEIHGLCRSCKSVSAAASEKADKH
ncbi:transcriptional repressor [Methylomonas koyamae]|uniref:Fur family transcriptional regulator n=1 Tax=Methylomonas koyamae TaxID=702114 RepID=A0A291IK25_9GAMM|nr:transcriptional repressor [Methylomonas koyamae]ATG90745.1 Fur family transcriptional regulator [Methylomonas koyamae]OAI22191.1 Fur family transcriptional regulator [Methylomonas koyamae]